MKFPWYLRCCSGQREKKKKKTDGIFFGQMRYKWPMLLPTFYRWQFSRVTPAVEDSEECT